MQVIVQPEMENYEAILDFIITLKKKKKKKTYNSPIGLVLKDEEVFALTILR